MKIRWLLSGGSLFDLDGGVRCSSYHVLPGVKLYDVAGPLTLCVLMEVAARVFSHRFALLTRE